MGGCSNDIRVRDGAGVKTGGDESGDMGHVHHQPGADGVRDASKPLEVDNTRVGCRPGHDEFRFMLPGQPLDRRVIDTTRFLVHTIVDEMV